MVNGLAPLAYVGRREEGEATVYQKHSTVQNRKMTYTV